MSKSRWALSAKFHTPYGVVVFDKELAKLTSDEDLTIAEVQDIIDKIMSAVHNNSSSGLSFTWGNAVVTNILAIVDVKVFTRCNQGWCCVI